MKALSYLLHRSRKLVAFAAFAGAIGGVANASLLGLVNGLLTGQERWPRSEMIAAFLALCVLIPLARIGSEFPLARLGQETVLQLRMQLSRRLLATPLRRIEEIGSHRILSTLSEDVTSIATVVGMVPNLCINAAVALGAFAYLAYLSLPIFAIVFTMMAAGLVTYQLPVSRAMRHLRRARELNDDLYSHFEALTDGAKELKLHGRRRNAFLEGSLHPTAQLYREQNLRGMRVYILAASWGQLLVFVIIGVLIIVMTGRVAGVPVANMRVLSGYTLTLLYLMTPLQLVINSLPNFQRAGVALERIEKLGLELAADAAPEMADETPADPSWRSIELSGVMHAYRREGDEGEFLLGPIDLTLEPGDLLFVAGGNGSGKTTLAKLLTGLYVPQEGEIRLDGRLVDDQNRDRYRQYFSAVFSDFFLFDALLGLDSENLDSQANQILRQLHLQHKVEVADGKLSTTALSQGQRKRLALLVAYLENRPVYVFDEWAADQDPIFKEVFYRELLPQLKARGKAVVVISHDDRYYGLADRVLKLEQGKLISDQAPGSGAKPAVSEVER